MLVTILYRSAGSPAVAGSDSFMDTMDGEYYADAVVWAIQQEVIDGYGDGRFGTNDPITRQQMTAIFWRYAGRPETTEAAAFSDAGDADSYAVSALAWASASGVVLPVSGDIFAPGQEATRAQAASALMNFALRQETAPADPVDPTEPADNSHILVAYFSRVGENYSVGVINKGNTAIVAEVIAEQTGGDLFEIVPVTPYPSDYEEMKNVSTWEKDSNTRGQLQ